MSFPTWYTGYVNNIYLRRFRPTYHIPDGWRINGYDHEKLEFTSDGGGFVGSKPLPVVTEKGSQVIQQVYLYAITDGVVSKVEEVPQELRDAVGNLSTNLKIRLLTVLEALQCKVTANMRQNRIMHNRIEPTQSVTPKKDISMGQTIGQ